MRWAVAEIHAHRREAASKNSFKFLSQRLHVRQLFNYMPTLLNPIPPPEVSGFGPLPMDDLSSGASLSNIIVNLERAWWLSDVRGKLNCSSCIRTAVKASCKLPFHLLLAKRAKMSFPAGEVWQGIV